MIAKVGDEVIQLNYSGKGHYESDIPSGERVELEVMADGFVKDTFSVLIDESNYKPVFERSVPLHRSGNLKVIGTTLDAVNNKPVEGVRIVGINKTSGEIISSADSDNEGKFFIYLDSFYPSFLRFSHPEYHILEKDILARAEEVEIQFSLLPIDLAASENHTESEQDSGDDEQEEEQDNQHEEQHIQKDSTRIPVIADGNVKVDTIRINEWDTWVVVTESNGANEGDTNENEKLVE